MVAAADQADPWTGLPIVSLYRDVEASLRPDPEVFSGLDLLIIDLQDVGARYYTYAATAAWSAEVALAQGCAVWVLDRPNPLGGGLVEGNLRAADCESFVGAFRIPVRHGLTLGELLLLQAARGSWPQGLRVWEMQGWSREMLWEDTGRTWLAPSPNIPTPGTARLYPGVCLVEATELSEGRGTTRPFELVGAPGLDAVRLADHLNGRRLAGVQFTPTRFRPLYQKHAGQICDGVEIKVTDPHSFSPYRCGVELLLACKRQAPNIFEWRRQPYEFVSDRPAIDLLSGGTALAELVEQGGEIDDWVESWRRDEEEFRRERRSILLYQGAGEA
jgi:uncharacterized protein YbbC (DUF1343 family)